MQVGEEIQVLAAMHYPLSRDNLIWAVKDTGFARFGT